MDRDLAAFLTQFSAALHKSATYPPGHPLAAAAVEEAWRSLDALLRQRAVLPLGIASTRLIIDGETTDPRQVVLRELAQRLYRWHLGGIAFLAGAEPHELSQLLRALTGEPVPGATADSLPQWPHIQLHPLAFGELQLADADGTRATGDGVLGRLWRELASAALIKSGELPEESKPDAEAVARAIEGHVLNPAYVRGVASRLLALGRQAHTAGGAEGQAVSQRVAELLGSLRPETLRRLLEVGLDPSQRQQLLAEGFRGLPVAAVVELLRASAAAAQQGISHSMLRILTKLAAHAQEGAPTGGREADEALRDMVRELIRDWDLKDPNPAPYGAMLEGVSLPWTSPGATAAADEVAHTEPVRVLQVALEIGATGPAVDAAVATLVEQEELPALIGLLAGAPAGDPVAEAVWARLPTRTALERVLSEAELDGVMVEQLLQRLGLEAAGPLLDALATAESRTTRRRLLSWLERLGPDIGPLVVKRLDSPHWYVSRNLLVLLGSLEPWPAGFSPAAYLTHPDARVRREAFKLALKGPDVRDAAICIGLADRDLWIVRSVLTAAMDGCPSEAAPHLVRELEQGSRPSDIRVQIVRVLGGIPSPAARDCLLRRALARRRWLPWRRLVPKSQESLAAIAGLARQWRADPAAAVVLRLAGRSPDAEVRAAGGEHE
jgi:hypothetical protein